MRCMHMMHGGAQPLDVVIWSFLAMLLLFLLLIKNSRKIRLEYKEMFERSYNNQKEVLGVLKEIRDSLKK